MRAELNQKFQELIDQIEEGDVLFPNAFIMVLEDLGIEFEDKILGHCLQCDIALTKGNVWYNRENEAIACSKHAENYMD